MGKMKQIAIELENASDLIKWMEHRITILERKDRVKSHEASNNDFKELRKELKDENSR